MRCHINKRKAKTTKFDSLTLIDRKLDSVTPPRSRKTCMTVASPKDSTRRNKFSSFRIPRRMRRLAVFTTKNPCKTDSVGGLVQEIFLRRELLGALQPTIHEFWDWEASLIQDSAENLDLGGA